MEIFELRYFLGVARDENIHRASEKLHVSPASLSKAIARLESELGVSLFSREGRQIRLTDQGRLFQKRAAEIVQLEESARLELSGQEGTIQIVIAGPEILLSEMGVSVSEQLKGKYPKSRFEFHAVTDEDALAQVSSGGAHLALVTSDLPAQSGLSAKVLSEARFQTVVGKNHPLCSSARAKKTIPVERVLEHPFVSPSLPLLGQVGIKQSLDGWRDDQFPRRVEYLASSLKLLEELVVRGKAVAYLPDYLCARLEVEVLRITGCPYTCVQKVRIVAKNPKNRSWLNHWF
jgi:DNA-binding transcriptional LysR family regulator